MAINKRELVNDAITFNEMLVIDNEGNKLGVFQRQGALSLAVNKGFDLVIISPDAKPPVARLMDYSKYKFEQQKRLKEHKKTQKVIEIKEIQLRPTIAENDLNIKARSAKKFISNGDKVKVTMQLKGRMIEHKDIGKTIMEKFVQITSDVAMVDGKIKYEENSFLMILTQKK